MVSVCLCRPVQPKILNQWYYLAVAAMAFAGGLFGVVLGNAFENEFYVRYPLNSRYYQVNKLHWLGSWLVSM